MNKQPLPITIEVCTSGTFKGMIEVYDEYSHGWGESLLEAMTMYDDSRKQHIEINAYED